MEKIKTTNDFNKDEEVTYTPSYLKGEIIYPPCEDGVVTGKNDKYVFVRYGDNSYSKATSPLDLVKKIS